MSGISDIRLRDYKAEDLDAVIEVFQRAVRETASRYYNARQIAAWSEIDYEGWRGARLSRPTWVAISGGEVIGFTDLEPDGHLDMMFVHPAFNGIGVASLLLAKVEQEAARQGIRRIFTEASQAARPFFARRGFTLDAEQVVGKRGEQMTNFRMHKLI